LGKYWGGKKGRPQEEGGCASCEVETRQSKKDYRRSVEGERIAAKMKKRQKGGKELVRRRQFSTAN